LKSTSHALKRHTCCRPIGESRETTPLARGSSESASRSFLRVKTGMGDPINCSTPAFLATQDTGPTSSTSQR
jgi:hypothetical protein